MATTTELPVRFSETAVDRIVQLGIWPELRVMLEHTKAVVPSLRSITVSADEQAGEGASILILAEVEEFHVSEPGAADQATEWQWDRWAIATFPPDVLRHVCMMAIPAPDDSSNGR